MILTVHYNNYDERRPYTVYDEDNKMVFIFRLVRNSECIDVLTLVDCHISLEIQGIISRADYRPVTTLISNMLQHGHLIDWSHIPRHRLPKELRQ